MKVDMVVFRNIHLGFGTFLEDYSILPSVLKGLSFDYLEEGDKNGIQ